MSDLPLVMDLFSGTGSATQPFVDHGCARVVRIDNNPKCRPDIVADVRSLPLDPEVRPLFVWASPPCTKFSCANVRGRDPKEGMILVEAAVDRIRELEPTWWALENVRGSRRYISQFLGEPTLVRGTWTIWGHLPGMLVPDGKFYKNAMRKSGGYTRQIRTGPSAGRFKTSYRTINQKGTMSARIPSPIAEAVHRAVCGG